MGATGDMRQGFCPQCGHDEVIEAVQSEFGHQNLGLPMCVTYDERWVLSGQNPRYGHGHLCLYVCRRCGFCQWYARNPEAIPISDGHRTRLIKGERQGVPSPDGASETGIKRYGD